MPKRKFKDTGEGKTDNAGEGEGDNEEEEVEQGLEHAELTDDDDENASISGPDTHEHHEIES